MPKFAQFVLGNDMRGSERNLIHKFRYHLIHQGLGIKLKSEFLRICKGLEKQFVCEDLILNTTIESEFDDFLNERYRDVRNMKESEFLKCILNMRSDIYLNFIKFPNHWNDYLYRLCQSLAVLPGSSVECERRFSNLNRIKSEDHNNLTGII